MIQLILGIVALSFILLPAVYFILLQWNENRFYWHWLGGLFVFWNISTFIGNTLQLLGKHNLDFYSLVFIVSSIFIILSLRCLSSREKIGAIVLAIVAYIIILFSYPDQTGFYIAHILAGVSCFVLAIVFAFIDLLRLIKKNYTKDLRKLNGFWSDVGLIIYMTWMSYNFLSGYLDLKNAYSQYFLLFGNAVAAFFLMLSLNRWQRELGLKGAFTNIRKS